MPINLQPVRVAAHEEGSGLLVFNGGWLIAVLVRLSEAHEDLAGQWFLETGYGRFSDGEQPIFISEAAAAAWFESSVADRHMNDPWDS